MIGPAVISMSTTRSISIHRLQIKYIRRSRAVEVIGTCKSWSCCIVAPPKGVKPRRLNRLSSVYVGGRNTKQNLYDSYRAQDSGPADLGYGGPYQTRLNFFTPYSKNLQVLAFFRERQLI